MEGNAIAAPFLLILILLATEVSDASLFSKHRMLVDQAAVNPNSSSLVSPPKTPILDTKKSDAVPNVPGNLNTKTSHTEASVAPPPPPVNEKPQNPKLPNDKDSATAATGKQQNGGDNKASTEGSINEKGLDNPKRPDSPPTGGHEGKKKASEQTGKEKQSGRNEKESPLGTGESCGGVTNKCSRGSLVACIKDFETGSKELVVQNKGEESLSVDIILPTSGTGKYPLKKLNIQKNEVKKVNLSDIFIKSSNLVLNAGNGECVLHMDPLVFEGNYFVHLPSYDYLVTPINGAYFLIATVVVLGGIWACCKFMRRRQEGIPYQELEMGMPESITAAEAVTVEGWDQGWDDDWDEEKAVKSPSVRPIGSISANGLTSRSSTKDGWENNWND